MAIDPIVFVLNGMNGGHCWYLDKWEDFTFLFEIPNSETVDPYFLTAITPN
jgi:hypothetical protein